MVAIAIASLALKGNPPWFAVGGGMLLGLVPPGLLFGVTEMVAPGFVIRRREEAMSHHDYGKRRRVADQFSKWLAIAGPRPWESPIARVRVRMLGLALTVFWVVVAATAIWISYYARNIGR